MSKREWHESSNTTDNMPETIACCDIGGTKVLIGLVDSTGRIIARDKYLVGELRSGPALSAELVRRLDALLASVGLVRSDLLGMGCSMAGMIDLSRGFVYSAPPLGWQDFPLKQTLQQAICLPVAVEMDAYAMTLGEAAHGAGMGAQCLAGIIVGTGIGAGLILDGRPYHGCKGLAGEFGHMTIVPDGPLCNCGNMGCLEALAAGPAVAARARGALEMGRSTLLRELAAGHVECVTSEMVFDAARQGDAAALDIVADTARYLGLGLSNLITLLNIEAIVLSGGVVQGGADLLLPLITRVTDAHRGYWTHAVDVRIAVGTLGDDAALLGAAQALQFVLSGVDFA